MIEGGKAAQRRMQPMRRRPTLALRRRRVGYLYLAETEEQSQNQWRSIHRDINSSFLCCSLKQCKYLNTREKQPKTRTDDRRRRQRLYTT